MVDAWSNLAGTETLDTLDTTLNNGFTRLTNLHADSSEPGNKVNGMLWLDTGTNEVKIYDSAAAAWRVIVADITAAQGGIPHLDSATFTAPISGSAATGNAHFPIASQINNRIHSMSVRIAGLSGSDNRFLWAIPVADLYEVDQVYIISDTATSSSDVSNNWTFQVRNLTANGGTGEDLCSTAKTTNGAEITANARYSLGVDQNNRKTDLTAAGEVLELQVTKNGSATDLGSAEITVQLDYTAALF